MREYREFPFVLEKEEVLKRIQCSKEQPVYETAWEELSEIEEEFYKKIEPVVRIAKDKMKNGEKEALFVILTLGDEISGFSREMFLKGEYLKGMLIEAMADEALFFMDDSLKDRIKELCARLEAGIEKRMDAPEDMPMEMQKTIYEKTRAWECGIKITEGYMYFPVKTMSYLLVLSKDRNLFEIQHDCRKCGIKNCAKRKYSMSENVEN
jgi:hypothetical protein